MEEKKTVTEVSDTRIERAKEAATALANFVNDMGHSPDAFAGQMMQEHRTLQQQVFQLMATCIERWATTEYYDLRNEDTIKICKQLAPILKAEGKVRFI